MSEDCLTPVGARCYANGNVNITQYSDNSFQAGDWAVLGAVLSVSGRVLTVIISTEGIFK